MSSFYVYGILWRPRGSSLHEIHEDLVLLDLTTNQQLFMKCSTKASQKIDGPHLRGYFPEKTHGNVPLNGVAMSQLD